MERKGGKIVNREKIDTKTSAIIIAAMCIIAASAIIGGARVQQAAQATPAILLDQVGYLPGMEKIFFFQANSNATIVGATFDVVNSSGTPVVHGRPITLVKSTWDKCYGQGNFTDLQASGQYHVIVHSGGGTWQSDPFTISGSAYDLVLERAEQYYYYARSGYEPKKIVPGYIGHFADFMDDGYWNDSGVITWKNLTGGWHDAGDYNKYMESSYNTQFSAWALAESYELQRAYYNALPSLYGTPAPDIVDEATWGSQFLQKMIQDDLSGNPRVFCGVFGRSHGQWDRFGYWGPPSGGTDNIPGDKDDRMVGSLYLVSGDSSYAQHQYGLNFINAPEQLMVAAALAKIAWIQKDFPYWNNVSYGPAGLLANATALHDDAIGSIMSTSYVVNDTDFTHLWEALLCTTELARWALHDNNITAFARYTKESSAIRTTLLDNMPKQTEPSWDEADMPIIAAVQYDQLINGTIEPDLITNVMAFAQLSVGPGTNQQRNIFNYCQYSSSIDFSYFGSSGAISLASAVAALCYNITGNSTYLHYACDNVVHWLFGTNPLGICQVESLGTTNLPAYHNRYCNIPGNPRGAEPGAVPNGIARPPVLANGTAIGLNNWESSPDLPYFDLRAPNPETPALADFRSNEVYITNSAEFLIGFSMLMNAMHA
ncbi:MAG TPA: glycoside hydrolase family 9 protein [Candidatus Lokiarchaeia archaeon]|nr:glycoside hydrolase family 9 protein [Candidatus Lokiarchaeia archaeon]